MLDLNGTAFLTHKQSGAAAEMNATNYLLYAPHKPTVPSQAPPSAAIKLNEFGGGGTLHEILASVTSGCGVKTVHYIIQAARQQVRQARQRKMLQTLPPLAELQFGHRIHFCLHSQCKHRSCPSRVQHLDILLRNTPL